MTLLQHQVTGVGAIVRNKRFALFDDPGLGKTLQFIEAWRTVRTEVRQALIVCPAGVRFTWGDLEIGELVKWGIDKNDIVVYTGRQRKPLESACVVVVSYELLTYATHLHNLLRWMHRAPTYLVGDESSYIKNRKAKRTKAFTLLRKGGASRVLILNGTPVANGLEDLWSQFAALDWGIINMPFVEFQARYCVMGGFQGRGVIGYKNQTELFKRLKPHYLQRSAKECLDLPDVLYTIRSVELSKETWRIYKDMRDQFLVELRVGDVDEVVTAANAGVKLVRLLEIAAGQLEGQAIATDKLDELWEILRQFPGQRVVVWCWFREQIEQTVNELRRAGHVVATIKGGQSKNVRDEAIRTFMFDPRCILVGQPVAGGLGLNLQLSHITICMTNWFSLLTRVQLIGRQHRKGQEARVQVIDVLGTGPDGQHTVDHTVLRALNHKEEISHWTRGRWLQALNEEEAF